MIDIIGAISLTALFGLCCAALISASPLNAGSRSRLVLTSLIWFTFIGFLASVGVFSAASVGTLAIGLAILAPITLSIVVAGWSSTLRTVALDTPLAVLVAIHAGRILGVFFLLLLAAGRIPPTFALTAGWGDIGVALTALPVAWAIHRRARGWQTLTFVWNLLGFVDLLAAVTLGVGSAPDSPVRFIFESPNSSAVASLPWLMIPGVLVPLYLLTHLAIFAQLARDIAAKRRTGHRGGLAWESSAR